ncbi:MAG TPA: response regulator [Polyangiaceae bacterium]|nr:response regulator [Polyangiaceae bacterium]
MHECSRPGLRTLLADAEHSSRQALSDGLARAGSLVRECSTAREARQQIEAGWPELWVTDLRMEDGPSLSLLDRVCTYRPQLQVVVVTDHVSVASAVRCARAGVVGYFRKPADAQAVLAAASCSQPTLDLPPDRPCSLEQAVWEYINRVAATGGSIARGASLLGLERRSLRRMLSKRAPRT